MHLRLDLQQDCHFIWQVVNTRRQYPGSELEAICCVVSQVRDRATLYLAELDGLAGGPAAITVQWNIPAKNLEKSLRAYLENGPDAPFDLVSAVYSAPL